MFAKALHQYRKLADHGPFTKFVSDMSMKFSYKRVNQNITIYVAKLDEENADFSYRVLTTRLEFSYVHNNALLTFLMSVFYILQIVTVSSDCLF